MEQHAVLIPAVIAVAPNGARKSRHDHAALPITPAELAAEAKACVAEGASMIHLHVRDDEDAHTLDVARYQDAISAIRDKVGDDIVIQVTSEAVGIYSADEQMDMVVKLQPEAVSLAIREIVPEGSEEKAASFFSEMQALNIVPQFILYSVEDLHRCDDLMRNAIIPFSNPFLQLVLGRYAAGQQSHPRDLIPFVEALDAKRHWSVCAFGPLEHAAASCALAMGGHVRVGFENNMMLKSGNIAGNNAELVRQAREVTEAIGRPLATANDLRRMF